MAEAAARHAATGEVRYLCADRLHDAAALRGGGASAMPTLETLLSRARAVSGLSKKPGFQIRSISGKQVVALAVGLCHKVLKGLAA